MKLMKEIDAIKKGKEAFQNCEFYIFDRACYDAGVRPGGTRAYT